MQKKTILLFWQSTKKYRPRVYIALFGSAAATFSSAFAGPFVISKLLDQIQHHQASLSSNWSLIFAYIGFQLFGEMIGWRINLLMVWTFETATERDLLHRVFDRLTQESMDFHANNFGGSLVSQTNKLVSSFERFWDTIIFQLVPTTTSILSATIILSFIFWQYAVLLAILSIVFIVFAFFGSKVMANRAREEAQASTKNTGYIADAVTNIMAIKSHGLEEQELERFKATTAEWKAKSMSTMRGFLLVSTGYSGLISTLNIMALVAAVWAADKNLISISVVYLAVTYTFTVARQLWEMNNIMRNYNRIMGDAHDMLTILNKKITIRDPKNPELSKIRSGRITFENVDFAYDNKRSNYLFEGLNLTVKPGEKIGLVGHSGGGKTTITKLLMRFTDIQSGSIKIDGQNIKTLKQSDLRKHISYVPQEPLLFHRTIAENISYSRQDAPSAEIEAIAKMAHAHEFIKDLPEGYKTLVGERGVKLSGGQRQRVVIARAMLKNAPILVLDEATSALDSESEALIQDALWRLMEGRTAIVVAHRLSTIQKMDRIIVMDNGKIAEEGTHKELLRLDGIYANLWNHQSGGFMEKDLEDNQNKDDKDQ